MARKINFGRLLAAFFAAEQAHYMLKRYVPQYEAATEQAVTAIKRKIGLKKTLWDDFVAYLGEDIDMAFFMSNQEEIDFALAEKCSLLKRFQIPREAQEQLSVGETAAHIKPVLLSTDIPLNQKSFSTELEDNGKLSVFPFPLGNYVQESERNDLKNDDPVLDLILKSRSRFGGWNDILYVKLDDVPFVVIRDTQQDLVNQATNALRKLIEYDDGSGSVSGASSPKSAKPRHLVLFKNCEKTKQLIHDTFPLMEQQYNAYKGCITKIDNTPGRQLRIDLSESKKLRLVDRVIDMDVYPEEVRISVSSDVMQFVERSLMKENGRLDVRRSYLFVGPPGCGKTKLISCIIGKLPLDMTVVVMARDTISELPNLNIRFPAVKPLAVIIEDIDIMVARPSERQILMNFLDGLFSDQKMITIMTANNPKILGNSFTKRPGRIDRIIEIKPGDVEVRAAQITKLLNGRGSEMSPHEIAELTNDFSFAQHREIVNRSALYSSTDDFLEIGAIKQAVEECKAQFIRAGDDVPFEEYDLEGLAEAKASGYPMPPPSGMYKSLGDGFFGVDFGSNESKDVLSLFANKLAVTPEKWKKE